MGEVGGERCQIGWETRTDVTTMKCPNCNKDLVPTKRNRIDVDYCESCRGLWLSRQELEQLDDVVFDFGDDKKGSLIFSAAATACKCPECGKLMKTGLREKF